MTMNDLEPLRAALEVSPENVPLRIHFAQMLMNLGRATEAEQEFRTALQHDPDNVSTKISLAKCYQSQGKQSHALVIVEELVKKPSPSAEALVLYAQLLFQNGEIENSIARYHMAIDVDPAVKDDLFEEQLGIGADPAHDEIVEGKVRHFAAGEQDDDFDEEYLDLQLERPEIDFSSVGGMKEVKEQIRMKIIYPLEHAEMFAQYGKSIGGGVLMYGAPGCGKTHLARATAGEINANFINVSSQSGTQ